MKNPPKISLKSKNGIESFGCKWNFNSHSQTKAERNAAMIYVSRWWRLITAHRFYLFFISKFDSFRSSSVIFQDSNEMQSKFFVFVGSGKFRWRLQTEKLVFAQHKIAFEWLWSNPIFFRLFIELKCRYKRHKQRTKHRKRNDTTESWCFCCFANETLSVLWSFLVLFGLLWFVVYFSFYFGNCCTMTANEMNAPKIVKTSRRLLSLMASIKCTVTRTWILFTSEMLLHPKISQTWRKKKWRKGSNSKRKTREKWREKENARTSNCFRNCFALFMLLRSLRR